MSETIGALKKQVGSRVSDRGFWGKHERTLWSSGFLQRSVDGATLEILRQYIEDQR